MIEPSQSWIFTGAGIALAIVSILIWIHASRGVSKAGGAQSSLLFGALATILLPVVGTVVAFAFLIMSWIYFRSSKETPHREEAFLVGASYSGVATTLIVVGAYALSLGGKYAGATEAMPFTIIPTASNFGALNAFFIVVLASPFAWLWVALAKRNLEPSTPVKFAIGIIQAGLGFAALVIGSKFPDQAGKVSAIWLVLAYLLHTTGELCLSPVGLSAVTKLSIPRVVGVSMGTWFLATALSETLATQIAKIAAIDNPGETTDVATALASYNELFGFLMWLGIGVGLFMLVISPLLKRGMHDVH